MLDAAWPSADVRASFRSALKLYIEISGDLKRRENPGTSNELANLSWRFVSLCHRIEANLARHHPALPDSAGLIEEILHLENTADRSIPQAIASVLAMILHCDPRCSKRDQPTNLRRPGFLHSTFPNSPGLSQMMADHVLNHIFSGPFPATCKSMREARAFVRKALRGRILDPSMESGQLLLAVAESWRSRVLENFSSRSGDAHRIIRAGWGRLCNHLLWGIDRNPLAKCAVESSFNIACDLFGIDRMYPINLFTSDFLKSDIGHARRRFRAMINNPPWGEKLTQDERVFLSTKWESCKTLPDTYLAYVEESLKLLKEGGVYAFALPASVLATRKASKLRRMLVEQTTLRRIFLVPGDVFADALTRSVVLLGNQGGSPGKVKCGLFDIKSSTDGVRVSRAKTTQSSLRKEAMKGWVSLFSCHISSIRNKSTIRLGDIAEIRGGREIPIRHMVKSNASHSGSDCKRFFGRGLPFGYIPVLEAHSIGKWNIQDVNGHLERNSSISGKSVEFSPSDNERVVMRSIISPTTGVQSTYIGFGAISKRGIITIYPKEIDCGCLAAVLNSSFVTNWVKSQPCCVNRTRKWKISIAEVQNLPIPRTLVRYFAGKFKRKKGHRDQESICQEVLAISETMIGLKNTSMVFEKKTEKLDLLMERLYAWDGA